MPQLTLKVSHNIDLKLINLRELFIAIHEVISEAPKMDISTCHSGVIQEAYSYIGFGDERLTKVYLELYWMESEERLLVKDQLGQKLLTLLETKLAPQVEQQNLICKPRVRIANLGKLGRDYHISHRAVIT
jgi:5-carboxymethyl-2-hydroxymuconate isomerase